MPENKNQILPTSLVCDASLLGGIVLFYGEYEGRERKMRGRIQKLLLRRATTICVELDTLQGEVRGRADKWETIPIRDERDDSILFLCAGATITDMSTGYVITFRGASSAVFRRRNNVEDPWW